MGYLLWCGRHLLHTRYQERLLRAVLGHTVESLRARLVLPPNAPADVNFRLSELILAITSANQAFSRYNPVPFHMRAIGTDRFANLFEVPHKIVPVQHWPAMEHARFCKNVVSAVREETEHAVVLTPQNTVVLCCQPALVAGWLKLGFTVLDAELRDNELRPYDVLRDLMNSDNMWRELAIHKDLHPVTRVVWAENPAVPTRIERLWKDPILKSDDGLTDGRNYGVYNEAMSNKQIIEVKWRDIAEHVVEGVIVDEGCSDGALLVRAAEAFPDSDFLGIDLAREMITRCHTRLAAGHFGESFVHFHQLNIIQPMFSPGSISTTICNSTAHELFSYAGGLAALDKYVGLKFKQLRVGGRLLVRDVVGPTNKHETRTVRLKTNDGVNDASPLLTTGSRAESSLRDLSTAARFEVFRRDFVGTQHAAESAPELVDAGGEFAVWRMSLRLACEFRAHVDYVESWSSEVQEQFAFFSIADWTDLLQKHGFVVKPATRAYASEWLQKNRFEGRIIIDGDTPDNRLPTNIVIVAEKPQQ